MTPDPRRPRPSWRAADVRTLRPELWLAAAAAVGLLLVEVWQSSRVTELSFSLEKSRSALVQAQARIESAQARLERQTTRAVLAPVAATLGLVPADARQIVSLPSAYLADGEAATRDGVPVSLLAWAERAARALVPEATARSRGVN